MARLKGQLFARLALDYFDHPKIMRLSSDAIVAHLEMIVYSRKYQTDGVIPMRFAMRFAEHVLTELESNDPDSPSIIRNADGSLILHGYSDMQETSSDIEARRQARRDAANARWAKQSKSNANSSASSNANCTAGSNAETETETETEVLRTSSQGIASDPDKNEAPARPDIDELLDLLDAEINANGNRVPKRNKSNRDAMRLLLDTDKATSEQVAYVIRWCQADSFWKANILSASKLRDKFPQLVAKARAEIEQRSSRPQPRNRAQDRQDNNRAVIEELERIEAERAQGELL